MTAPTDDQPGLFPEPPRAIGDEVDPGDLNSWQKWKRRVRRRIATGTHPLGYVPLHTAASRDPDLRTGGPRCGDCKHRIRAGDYPKCFLPFTVGTTTTYPRVTRSATTDIAAWWPACHDFKTKREETDGGEEHLDEPDPARDGG